MYGQPMAQRKYTQKQQVIDTLRKCGGYATLDSLISHIEDLQKSDDGLRGLQNTDITDAHGSIITDLLILSF